MSQDQAPSPRDWIGRTETSSDQITGNLARRIAATLGQAAPEPGSALPELWHWAYFQEPVDAAGLGADGHPARGGFLPPADRRNRMWAGGRLAFHRPLVVGEDATRHSTILSVQEKAGRTGSLLFVTVRHDYEQRGGLAVREEQDIVYREPSPPRTADPEPVPQAGWSETIVPTSTMLFRYSAVTFNGHRIHYDWPYATDEEGYAGLVVHGPLIATLLVGAFVRAHSSLRPTHFSYRGVRPLIAPTPFEAAGRMADDGVARVWAGNAQGAIQRGELRYEQR
ncbi:MaoC family dehydratase N-terminal domain-containing protein [Pigmentiphaga sp. GD03639]|uniref:FAS1-like dehydratase domain-containing protein n=1 Tax=Pigmentiphaga sp. GD03639 TaxID=2975354 RepID=UPI002447B465|nr:MaoC family dehydratase N-terminal domain-containing protein [Pigmentiphaga sp. GD03639]MDH2237708.1 MaoC family dehydratase N-terminal domain-containing protein [Pigmentiphaga sp. GD03639]